MAERGWEEPIDHHACPHFLAVPTESCVWLTSPETLSTIPGEFTLLHAPMTLLAQQDQLRGKAVGRMGPGLYRLAADGSLVASQYMHCNAFFRSCPSKHLQGKVKTFLDRKGPFRAAAVSYSEKTPKARHRRRSGLWVNQNS